MLEVRAEGAPVTVTTDRATARAFIERLYAAHHSEIYAYLARMLRNDELAADLTQDTFVKAYRAYDTLADHNRARAWLYQIAGHTALDELRRHRRLKTWSCAAGCRPISSGHSRASRRASARRCSCRSSTR